MGIEKGWEEVWKSGWNPAPEGLIGSAITGRIAKNLMAGCMEMLCGRKLNTQEETICGATGLFIAVGLQVGVFSGGGLAALLTPAAGAALAYIAVAGAVTNLAIFLIEKPLKSLANYSGKVFANPPEPAPTPATISWFQAPVRSR